MKDIFWWILMKMGKVCDSNVVSCLQTFEGKGIVQNQ